MGHTYMEPQRPSSKAKGPPVLPGDMMGKIAAFTDLDTISAMIEAPVLDARDIMHHMPPPEKLPYDIIVKFANYQKPNKYDTYLRKIAGDLRQYILSVDKVSGPATELSDNMYAAIAHYLRIGDGLTLDGTPMEQCIRAGSFRHVLVTRYSEKRTLVRFYTRNKLERFDGPAYILYERDPTGVLTYLKLVYYEEGLYHRDHGPAVLIYENGVLTTEVYWVKYKIHRIGGPAAIDYKDGVVTREEYLEKGKAHRLDGPAKIVYKDGQIMSEEYWVDDKKNRLDGPAIIIYTDGQIQSEEYWVEGKRHRLDGPASILYKDGQITSEEYWVDGKRHNTTGPAVIKTITIKEYWINGQDYSKSPDYWSYYAKRPAPFQYP